MSHAAVQQRSHEWIWNATEPLSLKYEKTVGTLSAIRKALLQRRKLSAPEERFCEQIRWAMSLPADVFESTFTDPRAYHFARTAYDLFVSTYLDGTLPGGTRSYLDALRLLPTEAFDAHLNRFGLFVVSLGTQVGESVAIDPLRLELPEILPGTAWSFDAACDVVLRGSVSRDRIDVSVDGQRLHVDLPETSQRVGKLLIRVAPTVEGIRLQPPLFNVPGLQDIRSVVPANVDEQSEYKDLLVQTLGLIKSYAPETALQIRGSMKVIAFKPAGFGGVFNTSCSRLPGASIFTGARLRVMLADDLIHEFYHNRLFALEEEGDFLVATQDSDRNGGQRFYSPWRDDPRPIYGLFHAAYVFERVLKFWIAALQGDALSDDERRFGCCRAAKLVLQLQITLAQLLSWGEFTERGRTICEAIAGSLLDHISRCETLGIGEHIGAIKVSDDGIARPLLDQDGNPMDVGQEIRRHIATYDENTCCERVVADHKDGCDLFLTAIAQLVA